MMWQVKYLGDVHIEGAGFNEWLAFLEAVKSSLPPTENE
jgi:hypothetical protein